MGSEVVFLRASLTMRIGAAVFFVTPVLLLVAGFRERATDPDLLKVALCSTGLWYVAVITGFARWRVDAYGLERLTPLRKGLSVAWIDVTSIVLNAAGNLVFRRKLGSSSHAGSLVEVSRALSGLDGLRRLTLQYAPPHLLTPDTKRDLHTLRESPEVATTAVPVDAPEPSLTVSTDWAARWRDNPFFVLGLSPECSRAEVERAGQKLLALLAIDSAPAKRFSTPVGERERTADLVRASMAELRDPDKRLGHEPWARGGTARDLARAAEATDPARPWPEAKAALGWRRA